MKSLLSLLVLCVLFCGTFTFRKVYPTSGKQVFSSDAGNPLFLTPFVEANKINLGKTLAEVKGLAGDVKSYSGFFTVNKTTESNLFFWFFPAEKSPRTAPVVLWLQGGPGSSSLYGLFEESGPVYFEKDCSVKRREVYWSKELNVVYIDNPVGTGYSFTKSEDGYARDETKVGLDLHSAVSQFFRLFPEYSKNDFFVTGESYAGKYVPALAYTIHNQNKYATRKINLKGMAIGNGLTDPEHMLNYGEHLYHIGLIDAQTKDVFKRAQDEIHNFILEEEYDKAFDGFDVLLNGDLTPYKSIFFNHTGFSFYYNFLHDKDYSTHGDVDQCSQQENLRRLIHVGNLVYNNGSEVEGHLKDDVMQSVRKMIEEVLKNYRVLFYNGQLDIIVPYQLTLDAIKQLRWSDFDSYLNAERKQWRVDGQLAGYAKTAGKLTEVLVRNAGHMVPMDQPLWAYDLITRFAFNKPF